MPHTPLRELKPELFANDINVTDMFPFDFSDSDEELLSEVDQAESVTDDELEMGVADDIPLLPLGEQHQVEIHVEADPDDKDEDEDFMAEDVPLVAVGGVGNEAEGDNDKGGIHPKVFGEERPDWEEHVENFEEEDGFALLALRRHKQRDEELVDFANEKIGDAEAGVQEEEREGEGEKVR